MNAFDGPVVEKKARHRRPEPGTHLVLVDSLQMEDTREFGIAPKFIGRIAESDSDRVGAEIGDIWFTEGKTTQHAYNRGDFLGFCRGVAGSLGRDPQDTAAVQELSRGLFLNEDNVKNQPCRGLAIRVESVLALSKDGSGPLLNKRGEQIYNVRYLPVSQTAEELKSGRERVEGWRSGKVSIGDKPPARVAATPAPAVATPAPVPTTAPTVAPAITGSGLLAGLGIK